MKFGIYSDPHFNKRIQYQDAWEDSVIKTFTNMYDTFKKEKVDIIVCCGDFFDKALLEARNVPLLRKIMNIMDGSHLPSYMLLGNHEIDSIEHNILDILNTDYIHPVTTLMHIDPYVMIPYSMNLEDVDPELIKGKIVFSHHDLYGSVLAGGKTRAAFGSKPELLKDAKQVFNGHIHLRSSFGNIMNVGSIFSSQFGELIEGELDSPCYYTYDSVTGVLDTFKNTDSLHYVTLNNTDHDAKLLESYKEMQVPMVLRVMYKESVDETSHLDLSAVETQTLGTVYRKEISKTVAETEITKSANLDMKSLVTEYVTKDPEIPANDKDRVLTKIFNLMGGV